ncbi:helix-turn-helix domain-containing protein [candidate division WOR-3 bacterium]|uniref:Helix-turn-helix domain-containing protein n=1 Tax=candidate division WOR-3 bacterium TaxID=2052148 RepID=A0A9D5KAM2_UNCW3|nr:helix-turn-helix domain-containing protein [candidate division WOR-3 bacterium]MBD3365598.1 helix-turn-helix domain-containing protein [candidate division WOR-3 bacterium]
MGFDELIGQRIRAARKERGLNQEELSLRLGIHRNSLVRYERGERGIDVDLLTRLADALEVSFHWLVTGEGEMERLPDIPESERERVRWIPLLGSVPAGFPRYSSEVVLEYMPVHAASARHPQTFALIVQGDSMEPRLSEGDRVIVQPDPSPPNRAIVVALIDGETTIKELKVTVQGQLSTHILVPVNGDYPPHILGAGDRIIGRVVAVQKMLE